MTLVDANLLVFAHVEESPQHEAARTWLDAQLSESARVGLPWPSLLAFVRLVSNPRIYRNPEPVQDAWGQVQKWLGAGPCWIPLPTERHFQILDALMPHAVSANLVPDAHLAALAIEHGLELFSADGDFGRFPNLRWQNPLVSRTQQ